MIFFYFYYRNKNYHIYGGKTNDWVFDVNKSNMQTINVGLNFNNYLPYK
jgi:hypothetical protein